MINMKGYIYNILFVKLTLSKNNIINNNCGNRITELADRIFLMPMQWSPFASLSRA
jgi:hypothetical protein